MNKYREEEQLIYESCLYNQYSRDPEAINNVMPDSSIPSQIQYIRQYIIPLLYKDDQRALELFRSISNHENDSEDDMKRFVRDMTNSVSL